MKSESGVQYGVKTVEETKSPQETSVASVRWLLSQMRGGTNAEPPRGLVDSVLQRVEDMETAGEKVRGVW